MQVINKFTTDAALKSPKAATHSITMADLFANFSLLQSADTRTADGWVVTACYNANVVQLRKGTEVLRARLDDNEVLHFNMTPAIAHYHEQFALPINAK